MGEGLSLLKSPLRDMESKTMKAWCSIRDDPPSCTCHFKTLPPHKITIFIKATLHMFILPLLAQSVRPGTVRFNIRRHSSALFPL